MDKTADAKGTLQFPASTFDSEAEGDMKKSSWKKMETSFSFTTGATVYMDRLVHRITGDLEGEDLMRVLWLSCTLFFVVGGYWLLRTLKDPIMSVIDGVEYIPQAKIASLFVVLGLVVIYNKLLDMFPKHQVFYIMGIFYGVLFTVIACLLWHPTIGLKNSKPDPSRLLGWVSYVAIESFGSMVVQCFWALVNSSVNTDFAKKNFGYIVAGAQIGAIIGPSMATQAETIGIPLLYLSGSVIMYCMVAAMYYYVRHFGAEVEDKEEIKSKASGKEEGVMEGFYLFYEHDYVKGIFAVSSLYMIQVTVIDFMLKVLAKERYELLYPNDPQRAVKAFASFMGYFGITANGISFLFSLFGTKSVIKNFGLSTTLISFPIMLLFCALLVWLFPNIWMVFSVMMVIKGMSYALNNPTKEILYQTTSSAIKFKCKSWIDTFGQRSSKAGGSLITNAFASSLPDLVNYGTAVGVGMSAFLIWVSMYMGQQFEELHAEGRKVGEEANFTVIPASDGQFAESDTSCLPEGEKRPVDLLLETQKKQHAGDTNEEKNDDSTSVV